MLIGAPLVSGFASMAGCGDRDAFFQEFMSLAPDDSFPEGFDRSLLTCSFMASLGSDGGCDEPKTGLLCASSCQYRGACTGDEALAILFSDDDDDENDEQNDDENDDQPMTCATLPTSELIFSALASGGPTGGNDANTGGSDDETELSSEQVQALMATMFSVGRAICGLPPASRARKMTDAPPVDASKVHKLAAAMLRSTKTMAHRLAQVAVRQPPRLNPPPPPPLPPLPSPPQYTLTFTPADGTHHILPFRPSVYLLFPLPTIPLPTIPITSRLFPVCRPAGWASRRAPMVRRIPLGASSFDAEEQPSLIVLSVIVPWDAI